MPARKVTSRSALMVASAAVALFLAALLALVVNIGILRAAGSPPGPGRLSRTSVEREVPSSTTRPGQKHHSGAHEDRATPHPSTLWTPPATEPSSAPYVGPSPTPSTPKDGNHPEREFGSHADD